jgi:hypothetical protein
MLSEHGEELMAQSVIQLGTRCGATLCAWSMKPYL